MIKYRKAIIEDIDALEKLFQLTRQHTFVSRRLEEFKIGDYVKSTQEDEVWVAEEAGFIVGFVQNNNIRKFNLIAKLSNID